MDVAVPVPVFKMLVYSRRANSAILRTVIWIKKITTVYIYLALHNPLNTLTPSSMALSMSSM
jgi:hypothetical protein